MVAIFANKSNNNTIVEKRSHTQSLHDNLAQIIFNTEPGKALPSEPNLARQLSVSRATLREAMRTFETQGLIVRKQGVGTFVMVPSQTLNTGLEVLESIETMATRVGLPVSMGAMGLEYRPAQAAEAEALGLNTGDNVLSLSRVISLEHRPTAYLIDILLPNILSEKELQEGFTGSVLDLLLKHGNLSLLNSRCDIQAVAATSSVARVLGIQRGDVLLKFIACLYTTNGTVIDYSLSYFLPGSFNFHVMRRIVPYPIK